MMLSKFAHYNQLSFTRLLAAVAGRVDAASLDLRRADSVKATDIAASLELSPEQVAQAFCTPSSDRLLAVMATSLRYCPKCLERGFHSPLFQCQLISQCPLHRAALRSGCPDCRARTSYRLEASLAADPLRCQRCRRPWVAALFAPSGRCQPLSKDEARLLHRWRGYVEAQVALDSGARERSRNAEGWFSFLELSSDVRQLHRSFAFIDVLLERFHEPPPLEHTTRSPRRAQQSSSEPRAPLVSSSPRWTPEHWPHFAEPFLTYEARLIQRIEMLGSGPASATTCSQPRGCAVSTAAANIAYRAWRATWLGASSSFLRPHFPAHPAFGLTVWLALLPPRPREMTNPRWQRLTLQWLDEDLAASLLAWRRVARFMQRRGEFYFHPSLVRPAVYSLHRRTLLLSSGCEASRI